MVQLKSKQAKRKQHARVHFGEYLITNKHLRETTSNIKSPNDSPDASCSHGR